ncbi:hypothetical protein [Maricaulis sp.]|uniref:hypothetical protein n=1 Tax=Maricaulis sp. TaxID=1486257 RepID=UPI003A8FF7E3
MLPASLLFGTRFSHEDLMAIRERATNKGRSIADVFAAAVEDQVRQRQQAGVRPEVRALMDAGHRKYARVFEALARM